MKQTFNPFIEVGYRGPGYFCDREEESKQLISYIKNQNNVSLFAFRRLGKTGLIKHVFHALKAEKQLSCLYLDILATRNIESFINQLATVAYTSFPEKSSVAKKIQKAIQSLRPVIGYDELSGQANVSIAAVSTQQQEHTLESIFSFLDKQGLRIVIAIDEFQQILSYSEGNMEALLRTQMQQLKNIKFIFCGSDQQKMHELFHDSSRPFFASTSYLHLDTIDQVKYSKFINRMFAKHKRSISSEALEFICEWTLCHTFYTQNLCNRLFAKNIESIGLDSVKQTASEILQLQEGKFFQYRNLLTSGQWSLLSAIGKEQRISKLHSKEFINKYGFGTSSIVQRGIESLLKKELILHNTAVEAPYYEVYDKFLMRWLQSPNIK